MWGNGTLPARAITASTVSLSGPKMDHFPVLHPQLHTLQHLAGLENGNRIFYVAQNNVYRPPLTGIWLTIAVLTGGIEAITEE